METASPVTIITRADIELSGNTSVEDVLNNVAANSFGSWRGKSGYGSGYSGTSSVDLRGLGATLVLLDGRRLPGTGGSGGSEYDTSSIPLAIVDRIEILRDGASAIYGSDAVAGVVNIITKKEFDGVTLSVQTESPDVDGGLTTRYELSAGATGERGSLVFVAQHEDQNEITDAAIYGKDAAFSSYSPVARGTYTDDAGDSHYYANMDLCGATPNTGALSSSLGDYCGYAYGNVTWLYGSSTKDNVLSKFTYSLTDDLTLKGRVSAIKNETWSRYAPTPVSTTTLTMDADNPNNPTDYDISSIAFRTAQLGNRDTKYDTSVIDYVVGLDGTTDIGKSVDWNVNYQHTTSTETTHNYNLTNDTAVQTLIDDGDLDIFNVAGESASDWYSDLDDALTDANHTGIWEVDQVRDIFDGSASTDLYTGDMFTLSGVVGAEYEHLKFIQKSDPESGAGFVSGGSGGDDVDAKRDRTSFYAEFVFQLPYNIELDTAIRNDDYKLSGNTGDEVVSSSFSDTTHRVALSYRPTDSLLLRATWGEAFRAPTMSELYSSRSFSFPNAYDTLYCDVEGNASSNPNYCQNTQQHLTWYGGNPDLQPETSDSYTLGFVWNITQDLSWELGYWSIKYDNKVEDLDVDDIIALEAATGSSSNITRGADGTITSIQSGYVNLSTYQTSGYDMKVNYKIPTSIGDFGVSLDASYIDEWKYKASDSDPYTDYAGQTGYPDLRANLGVDWSMDDYFASLYFSYIGDQDNELYGDSYYKIPSYTKTNLTAGYHTPWNGKVTLGIANLFNRDAPAQYAGWRGIDDNLYDIGGRTLQFRYEQKF
ncbi:TonB-dependent receptor [Gallaecimonas mangrovi]|uniref:TonB-dependent receptor n=1 Tax=Gallaecimonas mangrovi TaxID=2291597 RepID=UPI001867CA6A|nr:TonB-dependent receptor [Gallaecimonas mangrovi]